MKRYPQDTQDLIIEWQRLQRRVDEEFYSCLYGTTPAYSDSDLNRWESRIEEIERQLGWRDEEPPRYMA